MESEPGEGPNLFLTNAEAINKYRFYRKKIERISETTITNQEITLRTLSNRTGKLFKDVTKEDITEYLEGLSPNTCDLRIVVLKKFYTWLYDLEKGDKLPDCIRHFKIQTKRKKQKEGIVLKKRERVITPDEYEKIINIATIPQHKAIVQTLYLFGVRVGELVSMKVSDVADDGEIVTITVWESKTKPRKIPSKQYPQYLMDWFHTYHPFKQQIDKPMWVSTSTMNMFDPLTRRGILQIVKRLGSKAGIEKNITCHDFRHTAITRDCNLGMPWTHIATKYGLEKNSAMQQVYDHNDEKSLTAYLKNGNTIERPETIDAIVRDRDNLLKQRDDEIAGLKKEMEKKTEIDNFVIDSLSLIAKEMIQKQGVESIKEIFHKYNVPLAED